MHKNIFFAFCLAVGVGGFAVLACAAFRGLDQAQESIRASLPVAVFFQGNIDDDQSRSTAEAFKTQDPTLDRVAYFSKEQAYADASKDPLLSRSLMLLHDNPLSAVAELYYAKKAWLEKQDPAEALRQAPGVQSIRWNSARRDSLLALEPWKRFLTRSLWGISIALFLWALGGVHGFALTFREWKRGVLFFMAGILGAGGSFLVWPHILPGQPYPVLPLLLGGLVGLGAFTGSRA